MSRPKKIITRDKALRIRLTQEEYEMIKYHAEQNNMTMSELMRTSAIEEVTMNTDVELLRRVNKNDKIPLYFSNGEKLVEIQVTSEDAITIADSISQISELAAEEGESYSTMAILLGITDKKSLIKHMEVNDD